MERTDSTSFGTLLRQHRRALGLTQEELAERAELSVRQLAYLEQDRRTARPGTIRRLADALNLTDDERTYLLAASDAGLSPTVVRASPPVKLPPQPTPYIGREREVMVVADLLRQADVRLLTLTGPGGTGKTRLAIQAAGRLLDGFPDGVVFVPLGTLTDPSLVASTVAAALELKESPSRSVVEMLRAFLCEKQLLLVLDNFEHLLPAASFVSELLMGCRRLTVLVTSRAVLHLSAEHDYAVPPLDVPAFSHLPPFDTLIQYDAVTLFTERARAARASFSLTPENAAAVVEICHRLDGLPLAIELAAARIRLFPPRALLQRLSSRLDLLRGGAVDVPTRQQSLRNTIDWSYSLLSTGEQTLFRRLSVFMGGCTMEAAEAVCGVEGDRQGEVLVGVDALVDQSLLLVTEQPDNEPRFRMLETVRAYALEQLEASGETEDLRRRHAEAFLRLAEEAERQDAAPERAVRLALLERENDNLRAALAWSLEHEGTGEMALRLAGALTWFWSELGYLSEGREWLEQSLALSTSSHAAERYPRARANVVTGIGDLATRQGDFATARTYAEQGVAIWRTLDDRRSLVSALGTLQWVMRRQGDHVQARSLLDERLDLSRDGGDVVTTIESLAALGWSQGQQGNLTVARSRLEEALALSRQVGHTLSVVHNLCSLAEVAWSQGDTVAQRGFYDEALANVRDLTEPTELRDELGYLAWIATRLGDYEQAEKLFTEKLTLARAAEDRWDIAWILNHLGDVARCQGDEERAVSLYEESLTLFRQHGERQGIAAVLHNLGHVALAREDVKRARSLFMESLSLFRELDFAWSIADCVIGLAGVAGQEGHPQQAALLYGAAEAAHEAIDASGMLIDPANAPAWEREIAAARGQMDAERWEQAWSAGRAMSIDHALTWADRANGQ